MYEKLGDREKIKKYVELKAKKRQIKEELLPFVWHCDRWCDWCVLEVEQSELDHFGEGNFASKEFHKHRELTDIFMMDVKKFVISDRVPCNKDKGY